MLLLEEKFVEYLWEHGLFQDKDVAGKRCLIVGGEYLLRENYAVLLNRRLCGMGAVRCDNIVLFTPHILDSYTDLTDIVDAVGSARYDFIIVLSGMEKTRNICEGVRQLQEVCSTGGVLFVMARTPLEISTRIKLNAYEDIWRYDVESLQSLFSGCRAQKTAVDEAQGFAAILFVRGDGAAEAPPIPLFHVRSGRRIAADDALPQGYFGETSALDAIGMKYRTDKCSMEHSYLGKYTFFLERFRTQSMKLLELGVFNGSSLRMWREYFPHAEIFGVDIVESARQYEEERIHIIQADLSDVQQVARLHEIEPQIIIDDASHIVSHQLLALFTLFDVLPSGGVYILEDLETSLNPELFEAGYRDCPMDAYEVCARIARIAARKVPDDDSIYADGINRIGMAAELVSIMKGSVVLIRR